MTPKWILPLKLNCHQPPENIGIEWKNMEKRKKMHEISHANEIFHCFLTVVTLELVHYTASFFLLKIGHGLMVFFESADKIIITEEYMSLEIVIFIKNYQKQLPMQPCSCKPFLCPT